MTCVQGRMTCVQGRMTCVQGRPEENSELSYSAFTKTQFV